MTGAEHYQRAEQLEKLAADLYDDERPQAALLVARAQVHATLALAAATVGPLAASVGAQVRGAA